MAQADPRTSRSFRLRAWLAGLVVTFERCYDALAPALAVGIVFLVLALFDVWTRLPFAAHLAGLGLFVAALGLAVWRVRARLRVARREEALARLENDSGIRHRALRALDDQLPAAVSDRSTMAIWEAHRTRLRAAVARLRLTPPRSSLPRRDPWALRAALLLALVVGLVEAQGDALRRLGYALTPRPAPAAVAPQPFVQLWITPPAYTGRAPLGTDQTAGLERLIVPTGSEALAQVHHLDRPVAEFSIVGGAAAAALSDLGAGSAEARLVLTEPGRLAVVDSDGKELAGWSLEVLPDRPPEIHFVDRPRQSYRGALRIDYRASDDYGVAEVLLALAPANRPDELERISLARPARQPGEFNSSGYLDLTAHPLAGLPVLLTLEARDGIDQVGRSAPLEMVLPERVFRHPLARAVIEQRKRLVAEPEQRAQVASRLDALARSQASEEFGAGVPLSLVVGANRTRAAEGAEARREVVDFLWELALFIEEGGLSDAERMLRALQEQLQQALLEGADDAELERLMNELQQAMDRYLEELMRQALQQLENMPEGQEQQFQPLDPSQLVDRQDLQRMLDQAREMMRSGARDAAREMLAQLRNMLENLQAAIMQQQQMSQGQQALSDLQRMIQLQQNLLDRSFQMQRGQEGQQQQGQEGQQQQGQDGQQGQQGQSSGHAAAEQEGLRRALGELMRRMGEAGMQIPRALGQAEMQMRGARDALEQGQPGEAAPSQSQALDLMQQAGQAMLDQMQQQQQVGEGEGPSPGGEPLGPQRAGRDPLGRSLHNDGGWDPSGNFVPDEADLGRARDLLEELFRRSGERDRPSFELDYYRRLLDRF